MSESTAAHGRHIGQRIAAAVLSNRADDGWPVALTPSTAAKASIDLLRGNRVPPTPFGLKRVQQFEPEPPYYVYGDGVVLPNLTLQSKKFIGTPADVATAAWAVELRRMEPVVRWNRIAHVLAAERPQDLHARARMFASLNTALADSLLSAAYWSAIFHHGRMEIPIAMVSAHSAFHRAVDAGDAPPHPAGPWLVRVPLSGFPALPAALAGAAEAMLRSSCGGDTAFALPAGGPGAGGRTDIMSLQAAAQQSAWAALIDGTSSAEGCVAGYELGRRIAGHLLRQERR